MLVIGLTGGIASGKSTVAAMLTNANIPVIDADILARQVTKKDSPALSKIVSVFGPKILADDHTLDRQALAKIVFAHRDLLRKLEAIIHPEIELLAQQKLTDLERKGHQVAVYMAPLIFETNLHKRLTHTILITAKKEIAVARAQKRDQLEASDIQKRIDAQLDDDTKSRLADYVIANNGSIKELYANLVIAWKKLTGMRLPNEYHD